MIYTVRGKKPSVGQGTFIAQSADIIGDVRLGKDCSVWFGAVLRGDVMPIEIGDECNLQDRVIVHGTFNKAQTVLEHRVSVGHAAILHGCYVETGSLIGMGAVLMDHCRVGARSLVAAGSLITEGSEFPANSLIMGQPAKVKRPLNDKEIQFLQRSADNYLHYKAWYVDGDENEK